MKTKRFIAFLLTLITVFSLLPLSPVASAEITDETDLYDELFPGMEEESTTEDDLFDVTIRTEGNGGYAYGGGTFDYGSYAYLYAQTFPDAQFEGWFIDDELVSYYDYYGFYVYEDVEVVAKFSETDTEVYSVTYDSGTGGTIKSAERSYPAGWDVSLNAVADEGYTFSYWSAEGDVIFYDINDPTTSFTMPDSDAVITAHWSSTYCMHDETENDVIVSEGNCMQREIIESSCTLCGETVRSYGYYGDHNYVVVEVDWEYYVTQTCEDCGATMISSIPREVELESIVYDGDYWSYDELDTKAYVNNTSYVYASSSEIDFIISDPDMLEIEEAFDEHYNTYKFKFKKTGTVKVSVVSEYDHTLYYNNYTFKIADKPKSGDINGDGTITSADARLILRVSAKLSSCSNVTLQYADTDGNEKVTASDARLALRVSAQLDDSSVLAEFIPEKLNPWYDDMMQLTLTEGASNTLNYFIIRQDSPVTWKSSNPAAVKVDNNGKITAVKKGFACIIVSNGDETFYYEVKVKNALQNKIDTLRNKYPDGYYWNNHTPSKTYPHVTETPCSDHPSQKYAYCKGQCAGFADLLFREVHGNVKKSYGVTWDNVKIGDYIRIKPHHSIFIIDVVKKGDIVGYDTYYQQNIVADEPYLIVAHCNWGMTCNISWDDVFTQRYAFDTSLCYTVRK